MAKLEVANKFHLQMFFFAICIGVMVLLGLLGDVYKVNCTWNLKAIDEFQSLLIFAGQI